MPHKLATRVYDFNPKGMIPVAIFIIGIPLFLYQLFSLLNLQAGITGSILITLWMYVYYGNNTGWRMRTWDERRLIFSSEIISFGKDQYAVKELETAAVYLESFDGFTYRKLQPAGPRLGGGVLVQSKTDGDNNKISFRHSGETEDFTFYLANYAQYARLQAVISDWSAAGVNVVVKQVFDDEFVIGEMSYFNTAPGIV
jgi:hypothetical protein